MAIGDSILKGTKKNLGLHEDLDEFDHDIITHVNTCFFTLNQLGLGPEEGFRIEDDTATWADFYDGQRNLHAIQTYVYLRVRLLFDPPGTTYHIRAIEDQIGELVYRLQVEREVLAWTPRSSSLSLP